MLIEVGIATAPGRNPALCTRSSARSSGRGASAAPVRSGNVSVPCCRRYLSFPKDSKTYGNFAIPDARHLPEQEDTAPGVFCGGEDGAGLG